VPRIHCPLITAWERPAGGKNQCARRVRLWGCRWIIDNQKGRRNIADIDRIALSSKRVEIVSRGKAKENLKTPTGGLTSAKLPKSQKPIDTRKESAKAAGVGY